MGDEHNRLVRVARCAGLAQAHHLAFGAARGDQVRERGIDIERIVSDALRARAPEHLHVACDDMLVLARTREGRNHDHIRETARHFDLLRIGERS
jgi:hypothetical protein